MRLNNKNRSVIPSLYHLIINLLDLRALQPNNNSELLNLRIQVYGSAAQGKNPRVVREILPPPAFGKEYQDSFKLLSILFWQKFFDIFEQHKIISNAVLAEIIKIAAIVKIIDLKLLA